MGIRCSMNGREYADVSDGIWDDGEFISWDWINGHLAAQERQKEFPGASRELIEMFDHLVEVSVEYRELTGRFLPLFGELGELYAEIRFGIRRHRPMSQGSDGKLGNDFVEIKTISPMKRASKVKVKRAGHFSKLCVVRITEDYEFDARIIDRRKMAKGQGRHASVSWSNLPSSPGNASDGDND
jgi:hypothetical protein